MRGCCARTRRRRKGNAMVATRRIDSHVHFWRLARADYGWLTPALAPIYRDFGRDEIAPLIEAAGVDGWVDMEAPDAPARIAALADNRRLKGIRPMIHDIPDPDWMLRSELG